jgi:8-oxo-dGTP pyrophosphatase MutT (NUDIX family)
MFTAHCGMAAIPRDASSVIIVRSECAAALLIRRHANLAVAGGAWAFPGGKLEPADTSADTLARLGLADRLLGAAAEPAGREKSLGLLVAACRETFEEIGVVMARRPNGEFCDPLVAESLQPHRAEVSRDAASFAPLLAEHGLQIDPAHFVRWSHWITPSLLPKRFDTRFFLSAMPPGQAVRCDSAEATELLWLDLRAGGGLPEESLIPAPPTRFSLGDLAVSLRKYSDMDRLMQMEAGRDVAPMMPKMVRIDGKMMALMPWDADYQTAPGEGIPPHVPIPAQYLRFPSRVLPPAQLAGPSRAIAGQSASSSWPRNG